MLGISSGGRIGGGDGSGAGGGGEGGGGEGGGGEGGGGEGGGTNTGGGVLTTSSPFASIVLTEWIVAVVFELSSSAERMSDSTRAPSDSYAV